MAALVPRAERAPAQLGDAITTPAAAAAGTRVRRAVARHEERRSPAAATAAETGSAEEQASAQGARRHVQPGDGVLAQLLAAHHRALVRLAVLNRSEAALVAAAAQLARVVLAVGLVLFEAVTAAISSQVGRGALRLVVWRRSCQLVVKLMA